MTVYSYIRLTKNDNDAKLHQSEVLEFAEENNLGDVHFIVEQTTLVKDWEKTQLGILISQMKKDDLVIVPSLMMLSRSLIQVVQVLKAFHLKGVHVAALDRKVTLTGNQSEFNDGFVAGLDLASRFESALISQRMREALAQQKSIGARVGRPVGSGKSMLDQFSSEIFSLKKEGVTNVQLARKYKTTPQNIFKWLKKNTKPEKNTGFECQLYCVADDDRQSIEPVQINLPSPLAMINTLIEYARKNGKRSYTDHDVMLNQDSFIFISDSQLRKGFILSWAEGNESIAASMKEFGLSSIW